MAHRLRARTMAWKRTEQRSLADALAADHKSLSELDDVHALIDWNRIEQ
jgi:transposase, IS5 family